MNFQISHALPPVLTSKDWVAIDLELFNAEKHKLHRPITGKFACLSICYSSFSPINIILDEKQVTQALENINDAVWIFHNASFDITHLRRWANIPPRKKIWDIMIIERIMGGGLYNDFALEDVVRRRLDFKLSKEVRKTFENGSEMTPIQIEYAATDAYVEYLACMEQKKEITKTEFKIWTDIDRKALWPILDFQGFRLDVEAWKKLAESNKAEAENIKERLPFNPASPKQAKEFLIKHGFKGLKCTDENALSNAIIKYSDKEAVEFAKQVLDYRMYAKRASTYGWNFIEKFIEEEDKDVWIIRAGYWVTGAETGRTSSSNPNMQNIPIKDTKDFRKCFIARPNHKLVIVDMGQQEQRDVAYMSQDKILIGLLQDKSKDIFVEMARLMYKQEILHNDPLRKQVKNTVYGVNYGMSAQGFSDRYEFTEEEAEDAINRYFNTFPDLYNWIEKQKKKKDYVETISGRKMWLNPYSDQCERNAINAPIQGSAADQMKIALGNIYEKWYFPFPFACVGYIHDELIFDVPMEHAGKVADFVSSEMINAAESNAIGIPFIADGIIADNWSEKE